MYPQPGTHTLRLPFRFLLPKTLPPTCHYSGHNWEGSVKFSVEVVGVRPAPYLNRRVLCSLSVLPDSIEGAGLHAIISAEGWTGRCKTIHRRQEVRRGICGAYSDVFATVSACTL